MISRHTSVGIDRPPGWLDAEQAAMLVGPDIRAAADVPVIASDMGRFLTEPQQQFTGGQGLLGFLASGVQFQENDGTADRAVRVSPGPHVPLHPRGRSIRANEEIFDIRQRLAGEHLSVLLPDTFGDVG